MSGKTEPQAAIARLASEKTRSSSLIDLFILISYLRGVIARSRHTLASESRPEGEGGGGGGERKREGE